jgi:sigma-B regulation protein RsbU (phosphoserine phosphatase)
VDRIDKIDDLLIELVKNMAVVIVLAYILTRTKAYANIMSAKKATARQKAGIVLVFGLFSIFGTLSGIDVMGAIANIRDLGPAIAGLIAGPVAGLCTGLIGGIHRFFVGGITQIPCSISTVVAGIAGGLIFYYRKGRFIGIAGGVVFMALMEVFHMGLALAIVRPFELILPIVEDISLPMVLTNALGMGIFAFIVRNLMKEKETQHTKELIEGELSVAREIQMSIVPKIFPPFPERSEIDVYAVLEPAKEVGGDLYDFFLLDDDHLCLTVGDVSGKGVPASLFMAVTKTLIKAKADIRLGPEKILFEVNNDLCRDNDSGMFVTGFLGILTISTGEMVFSNGGHNTPYLRRMNGEVEPLPKIPGMALGVTEDFPYTSAAAKLNAGDSLVIYTDGVTDAMNPAGELLSERRLVGILKGFEGKTAEEEVRHILDGARGFANGAAQSDDITVLALKYTGRKKMEYRLKNDLNEIPALAQAVEDFAAANHIGKDAVFKINLALDELLTNTISYGFKAGEEREILIRLVLDGETAEIEIKDDAPPFNPLGKAEPDTKQDIGERPIGGLGIHLVRSLMDEIAYRREADHNVLTLKKFIKEGHDQ